MNGEEFNKLVYDELLELFPQYTIYATGINEVSNIVLFDEPDLSSQKSRYRIAYTSMLLLDKNKPVIGVETLFSTSSIPPKNIVGPVPVYMITRKIIVRFKNGEEKEYNLDDNNSKLILLVILSEQIGESKKIQIKDLNEKFKGIVNLNSEYSYVKDFQICEYINLKQSVNELFY